MALTTEQQHEVDIQKAHHINSVALEEKRAKLESVRLAKEILVENSRNKPVDSREVTPADIIAFAKTLVSYVNG